MNTFSADPDFSQSVIDELYHPKHKYFSVAFLLGLALGVFGVHRFYLGKTITGALMFLTGGGGGLWWFIDLFFIKKMVNNHNAEEQRRLDAGEPPLSLAFLPPKVALNINEPPAWRAKRSSKVRVYGSLFLLSLTGFILGTISTPTGTYQPCIILFIFLLASLTVVRWKMAATLPVVSSLTRWIHRLRLYYYTVDPGNIWLLALRPIFGLLMMPFSPKGRAEVLLYFELGLVFSAFFFVSDLVEILQHDSIWEGLGLSLSQSFQNFIYTYLFVAPVGALITTQILLSRRDYVIWVLSLVCILFICLGLSVTINA